jgi:hypothetical protein
LEKQNRVAPGTLAGEPRGDKLGLVVNGREGVGIALLAGVVLGEVALLAAHERPDLVQLEIAKFQVLCVLIVQLLTTSADAHQQIQDRLDVGANHARRK